MKIAIVKTGALGDVVRTTTLIPGIRRRWAGAAITWITSRAALPLVTGIPGVHAVAIDEPADATWRAMHYDWIISLDDEYASCLTASTLNADRLSGAHVDASGARTYSHDLAGWFGMGILRPEALNGLATANQLKRANTRSYGELLYEGLALPGPVARPMVVVPDESLRIADQWLAERHLARSATLLGVNTGASDRWRLKMWGIDATAELAQRVARAGWKVLVLGGPAERERTREICNRAASEQVIEGPTDFDLLSFAALVGACTLLVCSDTLAMHLAIAARVPVIALFGPTSDAEIDMLGPAEKVLAPVPCRRCYRAACDVDPHCMRVITPEMVLARVPAPPIDRAA